MNTKRIVIIGGVAAGTSAAAKARRNDENAEIVIYDLDEHISYSGCGLPYFISGKVEKLGQLTPRDAGFFKSKYRVDVLTRHQVVSINTMHKRLVVRNLIDQVEFTDHYDVLVLATGATSIMPPMPGIDNKQVFTLRNPNSALAIRRFIDAELPRTAVVVGSGFIGLEMVESFSQRGLSVTVIEKLPQICPLLDPDMAPHLSQYLEKQKITLITGQAVASIRSSSVVLDNGAEVSADIVMMAIGVRPNTALAQSIGAAIGPTGAIAVNNTMQTSLPDVYACGDCAESYSIIDNSKIYRPLGSTANKTGRIVGDAITGGSLTFHGIAGTGIFKVFEMSVAASGLNERQAREAGFDVEIIHNIKPDKPEYYGGQDMVIKAIADRASNKLLGVQIVGYEGVDKRMDVFVTAMTAGMKVQDLVHLDLGYAPQFATTKDPVIYTGMIFDGALSRGRDLATAEHLSPADPESLQIIDARTELQYKEGHIEHAISMPLETLRDRLSELDQEKSVVTYCNKGTTGNAAQNILINRGFKKVKNLSGGYRQYKINKKEEK